MIRKALTFAGTALLVAAVCLGAWELGRFIAVSSPPPPVAVEEKKDEIVPTDGGRVVQVWGRGGLGHACPISPTEAYTADHVAVERDGPRGWTGPLVWGDIFGYSGTLRWVWSDARRDLSLMTTDVPFSGYFRVAKHAPAVGDYVIITGYDYSNGLVSKPMRVKVLQVLGGHLTYNGTPGPGSSGSCVILEATSEVVGVNVAMVNGQGIGVLVTDGWGEIPSEYKEDGR